MNVTSSRSLEVAAQDVEWPGPDRRNLKQTLLTRTGFRLPNVSGVQEDTATHERCVSPSLLCERKQSPPLSPSLRASPEPALPNALPVVEPGQQRLTSLVKVSNR